MTLTRDIGELVPEILALGLEVSPCRSRATGLRGALNKPSKLFGSAAGTSLDILTDLGGVNAGLSGEFGFR